MSDNFTDKMNEIEETKGWALNKRTIYLAQYMMVRLAEDFLASAEEGMSLEYARENRATAIKRIHEIQNSVTVNCWHEERFVCEFLANRCVEVIERAYEENYGGTE